MTQDFTHIGQSSTDKPRHDSNLTPQQRIVLLAIVFTATVLLLAGLWLVSGRPSPIPAESAPMIGYAFIAAAVLDGLAVAVLKRIWEKALR